MVFNSISFLIYFIVVITVYFCIPKNFTWIWLLIASYYFYMYWNIKYLFLILFSTIITYIAGILIDEIRKKDEVFSKKEKLKKCVLVFSIILNLLILFYFKYFNFFIENINSVLTIFNLQKEFNHMDILLPVGISFYTFQALSYVIDVYRNETKVEYHLGKYALFLVFFPQLVAGPIEKSSNLLPQFKIGNTFKFSNLKEGLLLMLIGFLKKIVIADRLAVIVNNVFSAPLKYNKVSITIAVLFFTFQIYCDFSAYSDIAIGCAKTIGYNLMINFNKPYLSETIGEFWRRWHISLGNWFKDYLYVPLGGKSDNKLKNYRNLLLVFFISGLWHGASWNFIIWGGIHGIYLIIEKNTNNMKIKAVYKAFRIFKVFILVSIAWIFFRANNLRDAIFILKSLLLFPFNLDTSQIFNLGLDKKDFFLSIGLIIILMLSEFYNLKNKIINMKNTKLIARWAIYYILIFIIVIFGYYGDTVQNNFIYFQF